MANGLIEQGFTRSPSDSCLFYILNPDKSDIIPITTWVDDCIVSFSNPVSWNDMLKKMVSMLEDMLANEECYNEKFLTRALRDKYPSRFISAKAEAFSRWRVLFTGDMEGVLV